MSSLSYLPDCEYYWASAWCDEASFVGKFITNIKKNLKTLYDFWIVYLLLGLGGEIGGKKITGET